MSRCERKFELLIFDWDGTLLDSIASIVECTQATLEELGLPRADERLVRSAIGLGLRETVERLSPGCDDGHFHRIVQTYRRQWFEVFSHRPKLFPGVNEILMELRDDGFLLAVATAKSRRGLDRDLRTTGLSPTFHATRTADEARSKPHPQMVLDILDELGVRAADTLLVGDTTHDLEMARNAGVRAAAVCTGSQSRERLEQAAAPRCFENLAELSRWLGDGSTGERSD